jgi:hypothetical protein
MASVVHHDRKGHNQSRRSNPNAWLREAGRIGLGRCRWKGGQPAQGLGPFRLVRSPCIPDTASPALIGLIGYRPTRLGSSAAACTICWTHRNIRSMCLVALILPRSRLAFEILPVLMQDRAWFWFAMAGDCVQLAVDDTGQGMDAGMAFLQKPFTLKIPAVKTREVLDALLEPPNQT